MSHHPMRSEAPCPHHQLPDPARQHIRRKRLGQDIYPALKMPMIEQRILGIAECEQHQRCDARIESAITQMLLVAGADLGCYAARKQFSGTLLIAKTKSDRARFGLNGSSLRREIGGI